jgi:hypothetical protein
LKSKGLCAVGPTQRAWDGGIVLAQWMLNCQDVGDMGEGQQQ